MLFTGIRSSGDESWTSGDRRALLLLSSVPQDPNGGNSRWIAGFRAVNGAVRSRPSARRARRPGSLSPPHAAAGDSPPPARGPPRRDPASNVNGGSITDRSQPDPDHPRGPPHPPRG